MTPTVPDTAELSEWLAARVADYRELDAAEVDPDVPLAELGLDSVYALTLCGDIEDRWGIDAEPTLAWDHPTITALATHLHERLRTGPQA
ncbi:acyl carrier protein [Pseudonocardia tropica]|uniref:Acyl carrier protein n=1 Tax=Pseudonocardia tropica TaxID=681289 RepID=A0ABV1JUQ2_9PSEU